jgi:hypothetical protein
VLIKGQPISRHLGGFVLEGRAQCGTEEIAKQTEAATIRDKPSEIKPERKVSSEADDQEPD